MHHRAVSVQKDGGMVGGHRITGHGTTGIQVTGGTVK
jgi:hypothetical protein